MNNTITKFKINKLYNYKESPQKSKYSCKNCKLAKKKCTRDFPSCNKCLNSAKECIYQTSEICGYTMTEFVVPFDTNSNIDDFIRTSRYTKVTRPKFNLLEILGISYLSWDNEDNLQKPIISKTLVGQFIEAYFKHTHRSYPFINHSRFLKILERQHYLNDEISNYFEFETYMVMAIGCTTLSRAGLLQQEDIYSQYFSYKAKKFLAKGIVISDLELIKSLLLLCIFSFFEPKGIHSWTLFGVVSRKSISLGLNKHLVVSNPIDNEMRIRLFWSIYNMDRLLSVSLGKSLSIDERDINIPLPQILIGEENFTFKTILSIITLRQIEGKIIAKLYLVNSKKYYEESAIDEIKLELDEWLEINKPNSPSNANYLSFHISNEWYYCRYFHNLMLLYRPSYLNPQPMIDKLSNLGNYCLKNILYTHALFKSNLLPLNWITLYRVLTICSTTLYCLCNASIELAESQDEIYLLIEILQKFSKNWIVARKCVQVFEKIVQNILQIFLTSDTNSNTNLKELSQELLGASSAYHAILNDNLNDPVPYLGLINEEVD